MFVTARFFAVDGWESLIIILLGFLLLLIVFLLLSVIKKVSAFAAKVGKGIDRLASSDDERIRCPECAEWIMAEAQKCRFCGASVDQGGNLET